MSNPVSTQIEGLRQRLHDRAGGRSAGFVLALLAEALLVLLVLTFGLSDKPSGNTRPPLVSFNSRPAAEKTPAPDSPQPEAKPPAKRPAFQAPEPPQPLPEPAASPTSTPLIQLSSKQMANADIAARPAPGPKLGPPDTGTPGDTARVGGSGPNGEPLYAAAWYREPYDDELSGYLSTATGPGWGLIACRTASGFRVEDCVMLGESPAGSRIGRAVLAASWQFRVRPPRLGGRVMVGEWVRIRIDYDQRP